MDKVERGRQADQLLGNEVFRETLTALEQSYCDLWKTANTTEAREDLHRYIVIIAQLKNDLRSVAITGTVEQRRQDELAGKPTTIYAPLWRDQRNG